MHVGFILFRYFPFGGLQRSMLALLKACIQKGHQTTVFTYDWSGERPPETAIVKIPVPASKSRIKEWAFYQALGGALKTTPTDLTVGFKKTPGLDLYYCGDTCYAEKAFQKRNFFYRYTPRCRQNLFLEKSVFEKGLKTKILTIEPGQATPFIRYYQTEKDRFHYLPPGISRAHIAPENRKERGDRIRIELAIPLEWNLVTLVGSNLRLKGVDRALKAIRALPEPVRRETLLLLVGNDTDGEKHVRQGKKMGLNQQVRFIGPRTDIPEILFATDILIHPAYREATGNVILEAAVAGSAVLSTEVCGFSPYILENDLGKVIREPFDQQTLNRSLLEMIVDREARIKWRENAARFAREADIYSRGERFVEFLERRFT